MQFIELPIPGCYLIKSVRFSDERGDFVKLFNKSSFITFGLETNFTESYITDSKKGVIRGLHFQTPPSDHAKLVCCITGCVRDGIVDLRKESPTYNNSYSFIMDSNQSELLYLPRGIAHGFASYVDNSKMWYMVSSEHDATADGGIHWDSVNINWWEGTTFSKSDSIFSKRDQQFPAMKDFVSPF